MILTKQFTNRESQSIDRYLQEIGKYPLLTPEEEIELAKKIKKGDRAALDKLVRSNLRFVVSVAKQYQNQGLSLGDLINEGNLGLMKAAERFDATKGFKFISYAVWWIRQSILQAIADKTRLIRLPNNRESIINKINKAISELSQEYEREVSHEEIAATLNMDIEEITEAMRIAGKPVSIDAPFAQGDDSKYIDVLPNEKTESPDKVLMQESLKIEIERVLSTLNEREADVLRLYYGIGREGALTLEEIGEKFNLTRERVRQIKEKAIKRLKSGNRCKNLVAYLG
ncbi:MAG TPA: RNA polymerase sigma factor RpoD/SigA [Ignavibacteriales bacterium]|nr:RNA polymerase sigma factor RpoD/SigA [Ignavibacteriales bacterium]HOM64428.1 RNA polymerase sigma factor RpoD/SigA [Ignavibacteriales bacterium]HPD67915.1 RNA polymerase sigma factor RpoD/SigA [Ignavibacteriales bacterium]HRR17694.1 RNA polymerase sigma factor RpoD/SigA [Ignavibacteriales bacterium]HRT98730.1 RNA polymerase sigma factor RpoD/SigA [Ignavibacteriales bacterium]